MTTRKILKRIEVCGSIASGKTTFTRTFVGSMFGTCFEKFDLNPFLQAFYEYPSLYSFETEIAFLLIHYNQIKFLLNTSQLDLVVCDFSIKLDGAYAEVTLSGKHSEIFQNIYSEIDREIGQPVAMIHLVCPEDILLERICSRGRKQELGITKEYLSSISKALEKYVEETSKSVPVIRINSHEHDFTQGLEGHDFLPTLLQYLK